MSDQFPVLLALLFVVVVFIVASNKGVVGLLASGLATAAAVAVLLVGFYWIPEIGRTHLDIEVTWKLSAALSATVAFLSFLVLRFLFALVFKRAFNHDSWLHSLSDGTAGGILSLLPSLVAVFLYFTCIRAAGTVQELNYIDSLARAGIREMGGRIPPYPLSASWRNSIERLPFLAVALDALDPFSRRAERNAAAFVLARDGFELRSQLEARPDTGNLMALPVWASLKEDPGVAAAKKDLDRVGLVFSRAIREMASNPAVRPQLTGTVFEGPLKDFVHSLAPPPPPSVEPGTFPQP